MNIKENEKIIAGIYGLCSVKKIHINKERVSFIVSVDSNPSLSLIIGSNLFNELNVRSPISVDEATAILNDILNVKSIKIDQSTWNRRYREYSERIKSGQLVDISFVFSALLSIKKTKDLSFGERKMLDQSVDLLSNEIGFVLNKSIIELKNELLNQIAA
jgi:CarD family transcriptional regulator